MWFDTMYYQTFKGAQLDLECYQGKSTIQYEIEVLNDDCTGYDLDIYSSVVAKVFYRKGGDVVITPTVTTNEPLLLLTLLKSQTAELQLREYWLEIYGVLSSPSGEEELLTYGILKNK